MMLVILCPTKELFVTSVMLKARVLTKWLVRLTTVLRPLIVTWDNLTVYVIVYNKGWIPLRYLIF